mmetsp:Transcript_26429/g.35321  ORF Transcript_26429/g.35321 Transcript_26429/m.35321 type:complete len:265 (-) Transcript_26429:677-1471(-)
MIRIHFLLSEASYDLLTVVDRLVGFELFSFLTVDLILSHALRQLYLKYLLGFFPAHLVSLGFADVISLEFVQEEECLDDLSHFKHAERFDIRQHLSVFLPLDKVLGLDHQMLLVVKNVLEDGIFLHSLVKEVVGVEIESVDSVAHGLILLRLSVLLRHDAQNGKLAIAIRSKSGNLARLPSLLVGQHRFKSETFLFICEGAVLAKGIHADDVLFLVSLEVSELDIFPLLILGLVRLIGVEFRLLQSRLLLIPFSLLLVLLFLFF